MNRANKLQSRASAEQAEARQQLVELFRGCPMPTDELLVNMHLYMRSSVVAKMLYVNELYQMVLETPGAIFEFGVWWGANMALFQSLRGVYEPYNYTRKVVGFDTFTGYPAVSDQDGQSILAEEGAYSVSENYVEYLREVLDYHEVENTMSHVEKYELVQGDASITIEEYLSAHPETIVALAYFDMQLYAPTKKCLEALKPHVTKGSVIAMDELNSFEFPGETIAFREAWGLENVRLKRSRFLPDRSYLIVE